MKQNIGNHLAIIRGLQKKYPDLHIGGSIGLFLHGISFSRDLSSSDIDACKAIDNINKPRNLFPEAGSSQDFEYRFFHNKIKIELRIDAYQESSIVIFDGHPYKVTELSTIIGFKTQYAKLGEPKHVNDLITIKQYLQCQKK